MRKDKKNYAILVVDDERELCDLIGCQIESDLIGCDTTYSGEDAIDRLKLKTYDIVITDIKMPGMNGLELIQRMKQEIDPLPSTYIMTGFSEFSDEQIKEAGGLKLFEKPGGIKDLVEQIQLLCKKVA